jgi:hypothetical protein
MQELLASYLLQYKKCPLPGIGSLAVHRNEAVIIAGEKRITAPAEEIVFSQTESDADDLYDFIAAQKGISKEEAAYQLGRYCEELKQLHDNEKISISDIGTFYKNANGSTAFTPVQVSLSATDIYAEKVIHPDRSHAILVGDTETTNVAMNEYYAEEEPKAKSRWWIFALILFLIAVVLIIFYLNDPAHNNNFGISHKYEVDSTGKTYKTLP